MSSERVEVYFEHGPVFVQEVRRPYSAVLENGIALEEHFFGGPGQSANFRVTASKEVSEWNQVAPAHRSLTAVLEKVRLLWPIVGGLRVEMPFVSNQEAVEQALLANEGKRRVSASASCPIEWSGTYSKMPLADAVAALRRLRVESTAGKILWLCAEWFEMADASQQPLDMFMKAFPPLDLLATRHHKTVERSPEVERVLSEIRQVIETNATVLGKRRRDILLSSLNGTALRDKFEAFVGDRLRREADSLASAFRDLNETRNLVFHEAGAVSMEQAREAKLLLWKCIRAELGHLADGT